MTDADFENAVARAGELLRASRAPLIAGLRADVAGIVAAFRLAEKLGAAVDHAGAEWALRDQAVLQDIGLMVASPGEVRRRADTLLVVGDRPLEAWSDLRDLVSEPVQHGSPDEKPRRAIALTSHALKLSGGSAETWLRAEPASLPFLLAALRARVNGRPLARDFERAAEVEHATEILKSAVFGVALWCPDEIDALTIEMLTGLVKDLNATTRWSGLSVAGDGSVTAAAMASGWMSGLPLRVSFARGRPEHDPWQYDARRMVETSEADVIVWISSFGEPPPEWLDRAPAILLAEPSMLAKSTAAIGISVGRPGRDHDSVIHDRATGTLVEMVAQSRTNLPTVADVLSRIAAAACPP